MGMLVGATSQGYTEDPISQYTAGRVPISGYNHSGYYMSIDTSQYNFYFFSKRPSYGTAIILKIEW